MDHATTHGCTDPLGYARARALLRLTCPIRAHLAQTALGAATSESLLFAARAAETRAEGIGLIFASPQFQRT